MVRSIQRRPSWRRRPITNWSGFYIGAHGGYGFGEGRAEILGFSATTDIDGGFGGAQIGYNMQMGSFLLGIEADVSGGDVGHNRSFLGGS